VKRQFLSATTLRADILIQRAYRAIINNRTLPPVWAVQELVTAGSSCGSENGRIELDEGRKRVIDIVAAILVAMHIRNADDLFGGPQGVRERTSSSQRVCSGRG
jgi:hypothetical protein